MANPIKIQDVDDIPTRIARALDYDWEDCGYGAYEYWGSRGVHTQWRLTIKTAAVRVDITTLWDSSQKDTSIEEWAKTFLDTVEGVFEIDNEEMKTSIDFEAIPGKPFLHNGRWLVEYEIVER
jgi:hypothetical protein